MTSPSILDGYVKEQEFSVANGISNKTCARYRLMGLPYITWGAQIYINVAGARDWLMARTQQRNQPRRRGKYLPSAGAISSAALA
jgi:hypothetical protein